MLAPCTRPAYKAYNSFNLLWETPLQPGVGQKRTPTSLLACTPLPFRKLKLVDPVAMPIYLPYEYLARSNNHHCKGTEIFVRNLLLHGGPRNVRVKLLADISRFRTTASSINPVADGTCSEFIALEF